MQESPTLLLHLRIPEMQRGDPRRYITMEVEIALDTERTLKRDMLILWDALIAALRRDVQIWNEGHALDASRQVSVEHSSGITCVRFVGTTYKQVPCDRGYEEAPCSFYLRVCFRKLSGRVEYVAEPETVRGNLSIDVGNRAAPALFGKGHEISLERASQLILERFLDNTGNSQRRR